MSLAVSLSIANTSIHAGETANITATIVNNGSSAVSVTAVLRRVSTVQPAVGFGTISPSPNTSPLIPANGGSIQMSWQVVFGSAAVRPMLIGAYCIVTSSDLSQTASSNTPYVCLLPNIIGSSRFVTSAFNYATKAPTPRRGFGSFISNLQSGSWAAFSV